MKKILTRVLFVTILSLFAVACSSTPPQKSNLTVGMIKTKIIEKKTTQTEILELFGSPNMVTANSKGQEIWTYNKSAYQESSASMGGGAVGLAGALFGVGGSVASSSASTQSMDLIITFTKNGVVDTYKLLQTAY